MALELAERELNAQSEQAVSTVKKIDLKAEMTKMASTKGGGAYIPPHRLRAMLAEQEQTDTEGAEYQRLTWEALRKSINGLINKVNVANIKLLVSEVRPVPRAARRGPFSLTARLRMSCSSSARI